MSSFKKVTFQPYEEEDEPPRMVETEPAPKKKGNFIMNRAIDRQRKLLRLILKLANVQGYNDLDHIRMENGSYMQGSDIVPLIMHALSPGKLITGLKEFVDLLHFAQVTPDMVINENVRAMLQKLYDAKPRTERVVKLRTVPKEPEYIDVDEEEVEEVPPRALKRKLQETEDDQNDEPPRKRPILRAQRQIVPESLREAQNRWEDNDSDFDGLD
ncbi:hypothetical protein HDE_00463 [Halotydeus destructor]|nr:hypothetical protein HDE_00463 [Halotydeus destructor]